MRAYQLLKATMKRIPESVRHLRTRFAGRRSKALSAKKEGEIFKAGTPQDVTSVRAKSQRHRKSTADRWNQ